jgi:hypothetical protein
VKDITNQTIALAKAALSNPITVDDDLIKAFTESGVATQGITAYDLQSPALNLYPVLTPLRNSIPRVTGGKGIQANWKAVTGINVNQVSLGLGQGNRGGVMATSTADYMAAFRGLGLDDYVTFEADYAAEGFQDVKALASLGLLRSVMLGEEKVLLGGNSSYALGTTPQPTVVASNAGGTLAAQTWSVICVALTMDGFTTASIANGIRGLVTRTNADQSVDTYGGGSARQSLAATGVVGAGGMGSLTSTVASLEGASAYAWFWGAQGAEVLGAITTINSISITAPASGTQTAASLGANDNSTNQLIFDGLLTQVLKNGAGYFSAQPTGAAGQGTPLTADNDGGIVEINNALQWFWDDYRLSPDKIWVSSQEQKNINRKIMQAGGNAAQRFVFSTDQGNVKGGVMVRSYLNPFSMDGAQEIPIKIHPNLPPGTIQFDCDEIPYSLSGVATLKRLLCRRDYYQIEWPIKSRKREYGVYFDGVLQNFFPPATGTITNIANG